MAENNLGLNFNVTIRGVDRRGNTIYYIKKHNKATNQLVDGILRFLKGDFTETGNPNQKNTPIPEEAKNYTPTNVWLGTNGIEFNEQTGKNKAVLRINKGTQIQPSFNQMDLVEPISRTELSLNKIELKTMKTSYSSNLNDTEVLFLSTYIPAGQLVGVVNSNSEFVPYSHSYYSTYHQSYCASFTEVGLYSNNGFLLARVLLDGDADIVDKDGNPVGEGESGTIRSTVPNGPIYQTESTTIIIEWRISLTALGDNDDITSVSRI